MGEIRPGDKRHSNLPPDHYHSENPEPFEISDLLTLGQAGQLLPNRKSADTLRRWTERGRRGVLLRFVSDGRDRLTTTEWLADFLIAVAAAERRGSPSRHRSDPTPAPQPRRPKARRSRTRRSDRSNDTLRRYGLNPDADEGEEN